MTINSSFLDKLQEVAVHQRGSYKTVKALIHEFGSGIISIPDYQRTFVWDLPKQCRFIESIFLKIPVPAIFLLEKSGDDIGSRKVFEVIDGVQRLTTLCSFFNGTLKLDGLRKVPELNNTKYATLPQEVKDDFLDRKLRTQIILEDTQPEIQFEVFGRLNQGSVSLNAQELRNCMFHGDFNNFLIECSKIEDFRKNIEDFSKFKTPALGKPDKARMNDVELVLRFFCLYELFDREKQKYPESRSETLNEYMRQRGQSDHGLLETSVLREKLIHASKLVQHVFSPNQFRTFSKKKDTLSFTSSLNQSVFDVQMLGFVDLDSDVVYQHKDILFETFIDMSLYESDFKDALSKSTNTKVSDRVLGWKNRINDILSDPKKYTRKLEKKRDLFASDPSCSDSGREIKKLFECDVFEGKLYHRLFSPGNDIFKPQYYSNLNSRLTKTDEVLVEIAGKEYQSPDVKESVSLVFEFVQEELIGEDISYDIQRLESFDFVGSRVSLSKNCSAKLKIFLPLLPDHKLYFDASGGRKDVFERLEKIASLFAALQPFSIQ
jgi:hypothetical protein